VEFNTDIRAAKYTRDIAYATMENSCYRHNPCDKAKFEVSAHNFIDLSEQGYGLSILNDCKYGFEVHERRMMISLLKGPLNPDPQSDFGEHNFIYSLYPHAGDWREGGTLAAGLALNNPMHVVPLGGGDGPSSGSFMSVTAANVTLEAVKKCEAEDAFIVRVAEKTGASADVTLSFFKEIAEACECNLLEREDVPCAFEGNQIQFTIRPFEIRTFKIK